MACVKWDQPPPCAVCGGVLNLHVAHEGHLVINLKICVCLSVWRMPMAVPVPVVVAVTVAVGVDVDAHFGFGVWGLA